MTPGTALIELTRRCNLRCAHCTLVHPGASAGSSAELTRRQVMGRVDGLARAGVSAVRLYGGEIYLRRDLEDILRHIASRHMGLILDTNGTLVTWRRASFLSEVAPERIEIPLFGATAEAYESVTGARGSFAVFVRGVELLVRRDLPVRLRSVLPPGQSVECQGMTELAEALGAPLDREGKSARGVKSGATGRVAAGARSARTWPVIQPGEGGSRVVIWCTR